VVKAYRGQGRVRTLNRPKPNFQLMIRYDSTITLAEIERYWILSALDKCDGSITKTCKLLGMAKETLYRRIREYNKG
jgi:transcriptional regulator of acetoin/glycerol metabolism